MMGKKGKVVTPRLRFPKFRKTKGWHIHYLSDLTNVVRGGSPRPIDAYITTEPDGLNWLKIGDVPKDSKYITGTEQKVLTTALSKTREILPGDFILSNSMSFGRPYLSKIRACIHDGWIAVTSLPGSLNPDFLYYSMMSEESQAYFENQAAGGGVRNLTVDIVKLLPVCVPASAEQQKVADCLTSLDEVIAAQGQKVEALKAHKRGLMQQLFPREGETRPCLRFPEFRNAPEWEERKLGELAKRGSGHTPSKSNADYYNGGIKWVSLADSKRLDSGFISETAVEISENGIANSSAVMHPAGSVILCRDAGIGKSAILKDPMAVSQHFMVWTCNATLLSNWYLYYLFQLMKPLFEDAASGSTIKTIGLPFFAELKVMAPLLAEQQRIANCLTSLDNQIAAETEELIALKTHKRGLMQQLFPSPEPASA